MDKLNYTLKVEEIQEIKEKILEIKRQVIKITEKSKLILRKRVVKKYSTIVTAAILYVVENLSFQRLADIMAVKYGIPMSDTAWKKQINKIAPVLYEVMLKYLESKNQKTKIERVLGYHAYAIDATDISLEGKKGTVLRAHTEYDLSKKCCFSARIADIHTGESIKLHNVKENCLYFADRAYGKTPQMAYMLEKQADFIFRFSPSQVKLFKDVGCTQKMDFNAFLSDKAVSIDAFFMNKNSPRKIRVIIAPIPKDKVELTIKKVKRKASKKQHRLSQSTIFYAKWLFLATSLSHKFHPLDIISSYRNRWQIELHFKRSKSLLRFHRLRSSSRNYAFSVVSIWLAITAFVYILFDVLFSRFSLNISTFNAFSLLAFFVS